MSKLNLRIFNGRRQQFNEATKVLITIVDGYQKTILRDYRGLNSLLFEVPFHDNFGDNHSVVAYADGFRQAGFFPVKLSDAYETTLDIMLVPDNPGFSFASARWDTVFARYPFLGGEVDNDSAKSRYEELLEAELPLACLLNLFEAMGQIHLGEGTPLSFIRQIRWDRRPVKDRFYAYCDPALIAQVQAAAKKNLFAQEPAPSVFHPGATRSWKQIQFGEANVQLTFHEGLNDQQKIGDVICVTMESDVDYYKDLGAHTFLELAVNGLTHSLTDPVDVYVLRWMAGRQAGLPEFAPLYTLTS